LQACQKSLADVEQQVQVLNSNNRLTPLPSQED
jgi:exonuclease VII small subunit